MRKGGLRMNGRRRICRVVITAIVAAVLTGCSKAEVSQDTDGGKEEQKAQIENEMEEDIDTSQAPPEESTGETSSISLISPKEHVTWAICSEGIYCYSNGSLCGYLSEEGEEIAPCIYEEAMPFSEGLACVCLDGKYGYIGKDGETALPFIYDQASSFREGTAYFSCGDEYGLIDREGNVVLKLTDCDSVSSFREGLAYFSVDGQYGYMDKTGRVIVEPTYDDAGYFYGGKALVMKDGLVGVIGKEGEEILAPEYNSVSIEDDCILAQAEDRYFFFDAKGNEISSGCWSSVSRHDDVFYIYSDDRVGVADRTGKLILEPIYESVRDIPGKELVMVENDNFEYGILDYEGQIRVPFQHYSDVGYFENGQVVVELDGENGVLRYDGTLDMSTGYSWISLLSDGSVAGWKKGTAEHTVELKDSQGNLILAGDYDYVWKAGEGYITGFYGLDAKKQFRDAQGNLIVTYHQDALSSTCGAKYTYILDQGELLKTGKEDKEILEEILLTNQITPRAGAFTDLLKDGSVSVYAEGKPHPAYMKDMRQWKRYCRLYRMSGEDSVVLYFYAEPLDYLDFNEFSNEFNSGLYAVKDGKAEQLIGTGVYEGSMAGDGLCFWYDTEEGVLKPGTGFSTRDFGGFLSRGEIYGLKDEEVLLENSFKHFTQPASNYSEETLLEDAELFYGWEGIKAYSKETILEADSVEEYLVNDKRVSWEDYEKAGERYRYYLPLGMDY